VDEVNFSPSAAGDCVVCALYLPPGRVPEGLKESKQLTPGERLRVFAGLSRTALWCVVPAPASLIARVGVYEARDWAMEVAIAGLARLMEGRDMALPRTVLVDGANVRLSRLPKPIAVLPPVGATPSINALA
jgi:ribonuclease HII